jgi:hypothetical protein
VAHEVFGEGIVLDSRGRGDDQIVTVNFKDAGQKRLITSLVAMEVLEGQLSLDDLVIYCDR